MDNLIWCQLVLGGYYKENDLGLDMGSFTINVKFNERLSIEVERYTFGWNPYNKNLVILTYFKGNYAILVGYRVYNAVSDEFTYALEDNQNVTKDRERALTTFNSKRWTP